jgi:2-C-methyl-D-erythritol 4-phosphate cytidylyltransferase
MTSAIIVAAGSSQRMGFDKLFAPLCGKPVLQHTIERFEQSEAIAEIILVIHPDRRKAIEECIARAGAKKVRALVDGGAQRHLSVWNGLLAVDPGSTLIAVHDAARPLIQAKTISLAVTEAQKHGALTLAAPIVETLKRANTEDMVIDSVDRDRLWGMQTPQIFKTTWLIDSYKQLIEKGDSVTDEVSAVQAAGFQVKLLLNPDWNPKITFPKDLELASLLLELQ